LKHFSNINFNIGECHFVLEKNPSQQMAYLRPQDRHAHRTQGSTHAMSAEDQLIGLSFCVFSPVKPTNGKRLVSPQGIGWFLDGFF